MTTTIYETVRRHFLLAVAIGLAAAVLGCAQGAEGDRCNPDLSHNECNAGLTCQNPDLCPENYCCPDPVTPESSPFCQTGCAGGAQAICLAEPTNDAACTFNAEHPFDGGYTEPPYFFDSAAPDSGIDAGSIDSGIDAGSKDAQEEPD
jgi:hypothetical protein